MCQYPRQIEGQIRSQIRQIAYLNSKYRVMTKHYVSFNRRPIFEKHLNHSCVKQVRQTDTLVFQWIPRREKQGRHSYSSSDLFRSLSLVDNTDVGKKILYSQRNKDETIISVIKRLFGEHLMSI